MISFYCYSDIFASANPMHHLKAALRMWFLVRLFTKQVFVCELLYFIYPIL